MIIFLTRKFNATPRNIRNRIRSMHTGIRCRVVNLDRHDIPHAPKRVFINWGNSSGVGAFGRDRVLNPHLLSKRDQLQKLHAYEIRTPWVSATVEGIKKYPCISRIPNGHGGIDIHVIHNQQEALAEIHRNPNRFFVQLVNKKSEFRVHVVGGVATEITRKIPKEGVNPESVIAWNHQFGFIQREVKNNESVTSVLSAMAIRSTQILGYDFGAVDIVLSKKGNFFVLECNSSPSVSVDRRVQEYADYFLRIHRE